MTIGSVSSNGRYTFAIITDISEYICNSLIKENIIDRIIQFENIQNTLLDTMILHKQIMIMTPLRHGKNLISVTFFNNKCIKNPHIEQGFFQTVTGLFIQLMSKFNHLIKFQIRNIHFLQTFSVF